MNRMVKITHPDLGESRVIPTSLPVWLARGWTVEDSAPPEAASATPSGNADADKTPSKSDVTGARNLSKKASEPQAARSS